MCAPRAYCARSLWPADTSYMKAPCRAYRPATRRAGSQSPHPSRSRTACCSDRRRPGAPWDQRARSTNPGGPRLARAVFRSEPWPRPLCMKRTSSTVAAPRWQNSSSISSRRTFERRTRRVPRFARQRSILMSETTVFRLRNRLGLVFALLRPSAWNGVIGARAQIDEYLLHVAHDVRIGAERWHDALLRRVDVLAPVHHDVGELGIVLRLQITAECRGVTRSFAVGTVTDMAIRVIAAKPGIGGPIHRSVALHFERRIALFVVILSALVLDRGRITGAIGDRKICAAHERPCGQHDSHDSVSHERILLRWRIACPSRNSRDRTRHRRRLSSTSMVTIPDRGVDPRSGTERAERSLGFRAMQTP